MAALIQYANGVPGIKWPLDKAIIRIGRSDTINDISLHDGFASKAHAQIEIVENEDGTGVEYYVRDLRSTNRTYLNRVAVLHVKLSHNDTLEIGKSKFVFLCRGVREYVSLEALRSGATGAAGKQSAESLSADEEITKEFAKPVAATVPETGQPAEAGRNKFSRRLNFY